MSISNYSNGNCSLSTLSNPVDRLKWMEQKNPNNLSSIPDFVVKVPRTSSSNQSVGSKNTFQVIVPQESNIELVTKQHFWRQSALPDTSVTNRSDAWHSPDIHIDYAQIDPPKPDWLHRLQDLPPIYGQVLMATTRSYGLDTDTIYRIFLSSGLDLRVLQHIWSLANRSHPGWLTPSELVMALALIALAQQDYFCLHQPTDSIITNLSVQRAYQCSAPPLPNVALPSPLDTLSYDNFTEHFRAADPNVPIQNPVHSSLNGVCNFQISNAPCLLSSAPITTPQANDEDWADFTSCKPSGFGLPSWPASSDTVVSRVKVQLESNLMEDGRCPTAPHEDDFGEFQIGGSVKNILMPPGMPSNAAPSSKDPEPQLEVGTLPNYNLSADFESYESPRDTVKYEWMRCLRQCSDVFVQSLDALTSLTSAADREEFIGTTEARDFCLDLLEVHHLVRRIQSSATNYGLLTPELQSQFATLHSNFRKHLDYLVFSDLKMIWESPDPTSILNTAPSHDTTFFPCCGVCLVAFEREETTSPDRIVALAGRQYHLPCANFWINRVQLSLPALVPP